MNLVHEELSSYDLSIQTHFDAQNPWLIATTKPTLTPDILFYAHSWHLIENKEKRFALSSAISTLLPKDANDRFVQEIFGMFEQGLEIRQW